MTFKVTFANLGPVLVSNHSQAQTSVVGDIHHWAWRATLPDETVYLNPRDAQRFGNWTTEMVSGAVMLFYLLANYQWVGKRGMHTVWPSPSNLVTPRIHPPAPARTVRHGRVRGGAHNGGRGGGRASGDASAHRETGAPWQGSHGGGGSASLAAPVALRMAILSCQLPWPFLAS